MESDKSGMTCIVTIHGVGFEQAPEQDVSGYADTLHTHLDCELKKHGYELSDDPDRQSYQRMGESVPIYVESVWSPGTAVPSR